jgi:hypothetical protein
MTRDQLLEIRFNRICISTFNVYLELRLLRYQYVGRDSFCAEAGYCRSVITRASGLEGI